MEVTTLEMRKNLSEHVNQVAYGKERITLTRRGKELCVLVPMEDYDRLKKFDSLTTTKI